MYLFVKIWRTKPSWDNLSLERRMEYLEKAKLGMVEISRNNLKAVGWFEVSMHGTPEHEIDYQYCAVYETSHKEGMVTFHNIMHKYGWYKYFEQINIGGELESPGAVLDRILHL